MELNEKITSSFIDLLTKYVPEGKRIIDMRVPHHGERCLQLRRGGHTVFTAPRVLQDVPICFILEDILPNDPEPLTGLDFIAKLPQGTRIETEGGIYFRLITSFVRCDNEVYATWATSNKWSWHEGRKLANLSDDTCEVYPSIVKPEPLTGQAWATANLVTRPGSVIRFKDVTWHVLARELDIIRIIKTIGGINDIYAYYSASTPAKSWDWLCELDGLSDATVKWLYKAPEIADTSSE